MMKHMFINEKFQLDRIHKRGPIGKKLGQCDYHCRTKCEVSGGICFKNQIKMADMQPLLTLICVICGNIRIS